MVLSYVLIASYYHAKTLYANAIRIAKEALKHEAHVQDNKLMGRVYLNLAAGYISADTLYKAETALQKCYLLLQSEKDAKHLLARCYQNLAVVYWKMKNIEKALEYAKKSLEILKEIGTPNDIAKSMENIGNLLRDMGKSEEGMDMLKKALNIKINKQDIVVSCINIGQTYVNLAGKKEVKQHFIDSAVTYLDKGLKTLENLKLPDYSIRLHTLRARCYLHKSDTANAEKHLFLTLKQAEEYNLPERKRWIYHELGSFYKFKGDFKEAFKYAEYFINMTDSTYRANNTKMISEAQAKFDVTLKDKEAIQARLETENTLKAKALVEAEAEKRAVQDNLTIVRTQRDLERTIFAKEQSEGKRKSDSLQARTEKIQLNARNAQTEAQRRQAETERKQAQTITYITITIAGLVLMGLLYFVYLNVIVRRKNKTIEAQKLQLEVQSSFIRHRLGNNFLSVLNIIDKNIGKADEEAKKTLRDVKAPIAAMQRATLALFKENFDSIKTPITDMSVELAESFEAPLELIEVLGDDIKMEQVSWGATLFLANELIYNAFKYCYPIKQKDLKIQIILKKITETGFSFTYSDNGGGLQTPFEKLAKTINKGMWLLKMYAQTLQSTPQVESSDAGLKFHIVGKSNIA